MALFALASLRGLFADLPTDNTTLTVGRWYHAYDTNQLLRDNGVTWDEVIPGGGSFQPLDADLTALAALNATGFARQAGAGSWSIVAEIGTGSVVRGTAPTITGADIAATLLKLTTSTILTIATGAVTATQSFHRIDTEASAATDDLDTISGGVAGLRLTLRASDAARTVVLKHNTGNLLLFGASDLSLDETHKFVELIYDGDLTKWVQIGGGGGGSTGATDNALLRADGTGGATVQASPVVMDDSGNTNFADAIVQRALFKDSAEALVVVASSGATYTIDLENGNAVELTLTADCTLTFSNPPATGRLGSFTLTTIQDGTGAWAIIWPVSVTWLNGGAPAPNTAAGTKAIYVFWTSDGGTSWLGVFSGDDSGTVAIGAFTDLSDVPAAYTGQANKVVSVNAGETALEFTTPAAGSGLPEFGAATIVALSSDVLAAGSNRHLVAAAEAGTADDLIEITGLSVGDEVIVRADTGDTITVKHNSVGATDKIILYGGADLALSGDKTLKLVKIASGKVVQYVDQNSGSGGTTFEIYGKVVLYDNTLATAGVWDVSSLPQTYDHLHIMALLRIEEAVAESYALLSFNNDTTDANYLSAEGSYVNDLRRIAYVPGASATADQWVHLEMSIPFYRAATQKRAQGVAYWRNGATGGSWGHQLNWENTAAINRIALAGDSSRTFAAGSRLIILGEGALNVLVP